MAKDEDQDFCDPKGSGNLILGVYPDSGTVTQQYTGYSWKSTLGILSLPLQDDHLSPEAFSNHDNRDLWPRQRGPGQIGPGYPLRHFCVSGVVIHLQHHIEIIFRSYFKVSIICDEYIRYQDNAMYLWSNQVNGNTPVVLSVTTYKTTKFLNVDVLLKPTNDFKM